MAARQPEGVPLGLQRQPFFGMEPDAAAHVFRIAPPDLIGNSIHPMVCGIKLIEIHAGVIALAHQCGCPAQALEQPLDLQRARHPGSLMHYFRFILVMFRHRSRRPQPLCPEMHAGSVVGAVEQVRLHLGTGDQRAQRSICPMQIAPLLMVVPGIDVGNHHRTRENIHTVLAAMQRQPRRIEGARRVAPFSSANHALAAESQPLAADAQIPAPGL